MLMDRYDVAVIGAGVSGAAIARKLSSYELKVIVVEANADVAMGSSKANSAIVHAGYDCVPGTLMAKLNVRGSAMMEQLCRDMHVHYERCGSYVIAFGADEEKTLSELLARGQENGVEGLEIISGDELRQRESAISGDATAALYAPTGAITCPYELTIALCENAAQNGVEFVREYRVKKIDKLKGGFRLWDDDSRQIEATYVVNAAGLYADEINNLVGGEAYHILPRSGEYMLLDRKAGQYVNSVIFQTPTKMGKGCLVSKTVDGNVFAGPTARDIDDKEDKQTTREGMDMLRAQALKSVPSLPLRQVITSFTGLRAQCAEKHDFIIRAEKNVPGFINVGGICSPGLSSAPAIAEMVAELLEGCSLTLKAKADFIPVRYKAKRFREMNDEEKAQAIRENPLYGRIICRCETITQAEIEAAIDAPVGARTLDGVKHRTRAGMGRCQGGFCSPKVMKILSDKLGIPMDQLTKNGKGSELLTGCLHGEGME